MIRGESKNFRNELSDLGVSVMGEPVLIVKVERMKNVRFWKRHEKSEFVLRCKLR